MAAASTDTIEASGTTATLEDVQALLASFDVNKDGKLSREELQLCCAGLGIYLDDEDAAAAMEVIDKDHSGMVDARELFEFLKTTHRGVSIKTTLLRAALLARLSMHTAATVMRRMSSTEAPTERAPPADECVVRIYTKVASGCSASDDTSSITLQLLPLAEGLAPVRLKGPGAEVFLDIADASHAAYFVKSLNELLGLVRRLGLSGLLPVPQAAVVGPAGHEQVVLVVDLPMLAIPSEAFGLFGGISDLSEAIHGFNYKISLSLDKPFEELLASTEPLDRSLNADLVLEAHIPKHIVTVLSRLVESLHAEGIHGASDVFSGYITVLSVLRKINIDNELPTLAEFLDKIVSIQQFIAERFGGSSSAPSVMESVHAFRPAEAMAAIKPLVIAALKEHVGMLDESLRGHLRTVFTELRGIRAANLYSEPFLAKLELHNMSTKAISEVGEAVFCA